MYYGLSNFYQNHRRYVKSRDDQQLIGRSTTTVVSDCKPYDYINNGTKKYIIAPCGAIANSIFNGETYIERVAEISYHFYFITLPFKTVHFFYV